MRHEFKEGDRVRYTGAPETGSGEPALGIPALTPGEEGWLIDLDEHCLIVSWDRHGTVDMAGPSDLEWLGLNEPDPIKRVPPS